MSRCYFRWRSWCASQLNKNFGRNQKYDRDRIKKNWKKKIEKIEKKIQIEKGYESPNGKGK